jgi:hypothetical protein
MLSAGEKEAENLFLNPDLKAELDNKKATAIVEKRSKLLDENRHLSRELQRFDDGERSIHN